MIAWVAVAVLLPMLLGADDDSRRTNDRSAELAARRAQIKGMSQSERDRIARNYETFKALVPRDLEEYRKLHAAVEQDPELDRIAREYVEWLNTLKPWQQEDLRKTTDPRERLELVRRFKEEQLRREKESSERYLDRLRPFSSRFSRFGPRFNSAEFDTVMRVIREDLQPRLTDDRRKLLGRLSPLEQHVQVLRWSIEEQRPPDAEPASRKPWPTSELTQSIIDALPEDGARSRLEAITPAEIQRLSLTGMISRGLASQWMREAEAAPKPDQETLEAFFATLSSRDRDDIMRLQPEHQQKALFWKYQAEESRAKELQAVVQMLTPRRDSRPSGREGGRPVFSKSKSRNGPLIPEERSRDERRRDERLP